MTRNIYDDPAFFAGYSGLPRSVAGLDAAPEWPSLRALLPPLAGLRVVDLGCGFGWFCRFARAEGAAQVLGLDVSDNMLAKARRDTPDPAIRYERADLEQLTLPAAAFDLAYSSLALHYVADLAGLLATVHDALVPGGRFVFSIEHPIFMAARPADWLTVDGRRVWPVDSYQVEGERRSHWFVDDVVKQHRTLGSTLNALIRAGFTIAHVEDWGPTDAQLAAQPELAEERERPTFLLVAADRT
jgi:SAM-dependent methyltransferase